MIFQHFFIHSSGVLKMQNSESNTKHSAQLWPDSFVFVSFFPLFIHRPEKDTHVGQTLNKRKKTNPLKMKRL